MRVLIVDDSPLMRKLVERALRQAGLEISELQEAGNGLEALEALRKARDADAGFGVVMSDINMPLMDGLEMLEEIRREGLAPHVPIVMITTEGAEQHVLRAIAAGARGYICKPFTPEQVRTRVLPLLARTA